VSIVRNQSAERLSLSEYRIYAISGALQSEIILHKLIFTTSQAPLTPALKALNWADSPSLTVDGQRFRYYKTLRSNKFFANHFDLGLQAMDATTGTPAVTAQYGARGQTTLIEYLGRDYLLTPKSLFGFKFELCLVDVAVARFKEVTPFWTFSSRRRYQLEALAEPLPPLLLAFAFLLAVSSTYRTAVN
jgi:hypothetical protein